MDYEPVENVTVIVRGATFRARACAGCPGRVHRSPDLPTGEVTMRLVVPPAGFDVRSTWNVSSSSKMAGRAAVSDFTIWRTGDARGDGRREQSVRPISPSRASAVEAVAAELAGSSIPPLQHAARTDDRGVFGVEELLARQAVPCSASGSPTKRPGARQGESRCSCLGRHCRAKRQSSR